MKKVLFTLTILLLGTGLYAGGNVEVYYFHYTRRCATCQAVETESAQILKQLYAKEIKTGKVKFISINLDKKESKIPAKRCKADGQSLLVISGNKRIDLTEEGFMYARSNPEKLKQAIKQAVDAVL